MMKVQGMGIAIILALINASAWGAEEFDYPELIVTPLASARLQSEASREPGRRWTTHLPVQASALTTLVAGLTHENKSSVTGSEAKTAGMAVGAGWLAVTAILGATYHPYQNAYEEIARMPAKTRREQLAKERAAESAIEAAARAGRRLQWISFITNAGASAYMLSKAKSKSFSQVLDAGAIVMAAAPLVFSYDWVQVAREQRGYKKRIYGPVASATLLPNLATGGAAPGVALSLGF